MKIKRNSLSTNSLVGAGMPLNSNRDIFQAYHQAYDEAIAASKDHVDDEMGSILVFDVPFLPEPKTSTDLERFPLGHGLRRIKYDRKKEAVSVFYWVLKEVGSMYKSSKKVKSNEVIIAD